MTYNFKPLFLLHIIPLTCVIIPVGILFCMWIWKSFLLILKPLLTFFFMSVVLWYGACCPSIRPSMTLWWTTHSSDLATESTGSASEFLWALTQLLRWLTFTYITINHPSWKPLPRKIMELLKNSTTPADSSMISPRSITTDTCSNSKKGFTQKSWGPSQ